MTRRILVVSHPCVVATNQLPYAALSDRRWDVQVVTPDRWAHPYTPAAVRPTPLPELAGRLTPLPVAMPGRPLRHAYLARPDRVLRRHRPDVLFIEQEAFSVAALQWAIAAQGRGVPFGVQADENLDRDLQWPTAAWRGWVLRHAAFVAARSPAAADLVRRWGARGDIHLVPHHVPGWPAATPQVSDRFRVGFAGRLVAEKGLDTLVEAVRMLDGPVDLVVAGDGPRRVWLEGADLRGARLRMLAGVAHEDMDMAYAQMDVLVLPSRSTPAWCEQFGRVLVEAMSCGVPVVGSDSGEIPWVVSTTGGGRVVPEGNAAALASALGDLRDDPATRAHLAATGRQRAHDRFGVEAVASALDAAVGSVADSRPRVALVAHGVHDRGGMERAAAELVRHLHRQVRFVVVASELAPDLLPLVDRWLRAPAPRRPFPLRFLAFVVSGEAALRLARIDLVHSVGAITLHRADVVTVPYCHAAAPRREADGDPARRASAAISRALALAAERWCFGPGRARCLAPVSEGAAAEVARHYPGLPRVVVPNGVDLDRFAPDEVDRQRSRAAEGVDNELVALFVGGDWPRKGLDILLEAMAKARAAGAELVLWVVGDGPVERYAARAEALGVGADVRFLGRRRDTEHLCRAADLFVLPSAYETFSLGCFEAAASGLPLVITAIPTADELVGAGEAGIVVDRSAESVAAALLAMQDGEARRRMGAAARRRVGRFTWEASAAAAADLYRRLMPAGVQVTP